MNPWDVPPIQKRIVETCKILGKPVVIATQMLERYGMSYVYVVLCFVMSCHDSVHVDVDIIYICACYKHTYLHEHIGRHTHSLTHSY